jgi:hypothetical protein
MPYLDHQKSPFCNLFIVFCVYIFESNKTKEIMNFITRLEEAILIAI